MPAAVLDVFYMCFSIKIHSNPMKIRLREVRQVYPASQSQMAAQIFKLGVSDVRN